MDISKMQWGPDVSHYHPVKDWIAFANSGATFFAAKATEGAHTVDATFEAHRDRFREHCQHFALGVWYHFFHCEKDPTAQAEHFSRVVGPMGPREMLCLDFETKSYSNVDPASLLAHGLAWLEQFYTRLDEVQGACARRLIYTSDRHWLVLGNRAWERSASIGLWTARYFPTEAREPDRLPRPWDRWSILQYTDGDAGPHRDVQGIGFCDCNVLAPGFPVG